MIDSTERIVTNDELIEEVFGNKTKEEVQLEIEALEGQVNDLNDKYLRALADYQNLKRVSSERISNAAHMEKIRIFRQLLPVIDSFNVAEKAGDLDEGKKIILKQFMDIFDANGIVKINPEVGDKFDENLHEAVSVIPTEDENLHNTIAMVSFMGYKCDDTVLRYTKVVVYIKNE